MSRDWDQSPAAARLRAAGELEVEAAPPLAAVREVAGREARRAGQLMAFALALPLGAMAAGGAYVWKQSQHPVERPPLARRGEGRGEGAVHVQKSTPPPKPVEAEVTAPVMPERELAPAAPPAVRVVRSVAPVAARTSAPLTPTLSPAGERETPEIPAVAGYAPAPPPKRTSLAEESSSLSQALQALRVQHEPSRALDLLAAYHSRFPSGALRHEAALATVEAHRALGHTPEALAALEGLPHRPELDVLRAELNAELGRCAEARAALRGLDLDGALLERALFTDATCALTLGARDEAIADLERLADSVRAKALLERLK